MNTQLKSEDFRSELSTQLVTSATRILRGFVKLFMGRMTFDVMVDILRQVMVEEGSKRVAEENDGKVILSRVSLLTGIRTQSIKELQQDTAVTTPNDLTLEARILGAWFSDEQYADSNTGKPAELIIHGGGCTFQRLVSSVAGRGVTTQTVLERLESAGNVQVVNEHWVRLINPHWIYIKSIESEMLDAGSYNTENQMSTILHNIENANDRWTERSVWSMSLPTERLPELRNVLNEALKDFYKAAVTKISDHEDENMTTLSEVLTGVGLYYWERKSDRIELSPEPIFIDQEINYRNFKNFKPRVVDNKG